MRLLLTALLIIIADQLSKHFITSMLQAGESIVLIENFLHITFVRNPGAAFGMLPYRTIFFVVITIVVVIFIFYYYRLLSADHRLLRFSLALLLGGAIGNLIDRLRTGYVVDFIDFKIWPPVFNVADSAIVIGIGLFLIAYWRDEALSSSKEMS